jgi:hypothetical protein
MSAKNPNKRATLANLPLPVFAWLEEQAAYNGGTISSEIAKCCRARMESDPALVKDRAAVAASE